MYRGLMLIGILAFALCDCFYCQSANRSEIRRFPQGFLFGTATASYQVEGAWNEDGKTPSIWDHMTHTNPSIIADRTNGDIADDSYHHVQRDVEMMRELGLDFYRFSLSWPRILPTSFPDKINQAGVDYYNRLIDEMLKYNIEPMVTIFHWDLPQTLQAMGGWSNPAIVDWFADYARVVFSLFGDRVKYFITINEPYYLCSIGGGNGNGVVDNPNIFVKGHSMYMCAKNVLLAHAKAYHIYDEEFRRNGTLIFISLSAHWFEPDTSSEEDRTAAHDAIQFDWGLYSDPIFSQSGDYPAVVKQRVAAKSAAQGFPRTRLQEFSQEEIEYIRGTSDVFGLNHYSTSMVYRNESAIGFYEEPSFDDDLGVRRYQKSEWKVGVSALIPSVPWGFTRLLKRIRDEYDNPPVFITENGSATHLSVGLEDDDHMQHYKEYLSAMLDAMDQGCNVQAYTAWSMMDAFEWQLGYKERFGLYQVDYTSPARTRTPRKSAFFYKQLLRTRTLDPSFEPDTMTMTIDEGH